MSEEAGLPNRMIPIDIMRQIARAYRRRWNVEGMVQRLDSVLHSEIDILGHPRAALLAVAVAVLAYKVLTLIARCVERAHEPAPEMSLFHLAVQIRSGYEGMQIALPHDHWPAPDIEATGLTDPLLQLARRIGANTLKGVALKCGRPAHLGLRRSAAVVMD